MLPREPKKAEQSSPLWSALEIVWNKGLEFIDERRVSAMELRALSENQGWVKLNTVKDYLDSELVRELKEERATPG